MHFYVFIANFDYSGHVQYIRQTAGAIDYSTHTAFLQIQGEGRGERPKQGGVEPMMCIRTIEWNKQQ